MESIKDFVRDVWNVHSRTIIMAFAAIAIMVGGLMLWSSWNTVYGDAEEKVQTAQTQLQDQWTQRTPSPVATSTPKPSPTSSKANAGSYRIQQDWREGEAIMRVSAPGINQSWIIIEGTRDSDLAQAPGHFVGTAMPGQTGNIAIAGHRQPGMFWDLDQVRNGQILTVENRNGKVFTYRVVKNFITKPQSLGEVSSVPPGFKKGDKILTLTTCNPKWDNYERLVIHAVMV